MAKLAKGLKYKHPKTGDDQNEGEHALSWIENIERTIAQSNPYSLESTFVMALRGEWETGGVVEFFVGSQRLDFIKLPPALWAIMANLFLASIHSQSTHWLDAFVSTKRLITSLDEHDLTSLPTPQTVYRLTSRIRSKIAASNARKLTGNLHLSGEQWAGLVLENSSRTGYRIGLPPSQLRLVIGDIRFEAKAEYGTE